MEILEKVIDSLSFREIIWNEKEQVRKIHNPQAEN